MEQKLPRLVIAGTNSGCGKTTVTCAVLQALVNRGLSVAAAKCGPDYIDPMFHSRIIGAKSANLDPFFFDEPTLRYLLAQNAAGCAVTIVEGVMGYYDGLGLTTTRASTWETAQKTASPTILVVNARGAALSVLAAVQGFLQFQPQSGIRGVILNGCTAMSYAPLAKELEARFGIKACGYLPRLPACTLESRHLGLVTAAEVADLREKLQRLAAQAETSIDLDLLLRLADEAPPLAVCPPPMLFCGFAAHAQQEIFPVDWKEIRSIVKKDPERVRELVRRLSAPERDTTLTVQERIVAFFGQSLLTNDSEEPKVHDMYEAYRAGRYAEALALAEEVLAINPVHAEALFMAAYAIAGMLESGDESRTRDEGQLFYNRGIRALGAIAWTGNGSEEHPFCVTKVSDEYCFMRYYLELWRYDAQRLVGTCDVFDLTEGSEYYTAPQIWFDASRPLEITSALFGGK